MVSVEVRDKDLDYISKEAKHITALKDLQRPFHQPFIRQREIGLELK